MDLISYLPASTFSLLCASQLAFNAIFSFFINSQKFTPYILNSLVTLAISSFNLVFDPTDSSDPASKSVSKGKRILGFMCTLGASAGYGLGMLLTQCAFQRVIKRETFSAIMDMIVYQSLVASCFALLGFFVSGQWKSLNKEMNELGVASYVLTLIWSSISWQIFNIGTMGFIMEVSSLFSNVISILGLPLIPILSVIHFP